MTRGGRRIGSAIAAAAASLCLLVGCGTTAALPAGPSAAELDAAVQESLDRQWLATGLEGVYPRPERMSAEAVAADVWRGGLGDCIAASGIDSWAYSDTEGLLLEDGTPADPTLQLVWYSCFSKYPAVIVLSADQLEYMHRYYTQWLIPCLGYQGYRLSTVVPTAAELITSDVQFSFVWNPYFSLTPSVGTSEVYEHLNESCPATIPGIEGWENPFVSGE